MCAHLFLSHTISLDGLTAAVAPVQSCILQYALVHFQQMGWCHPEWNASNMIFTSKWAFPPASYSTYSTLPDMFTSAIMLHDEIKGIPPCRSLQTEEQDSLKKGVSCLFLFLNEEKKTSRVSLNTHDQGNWATICSSAAAPWPTIDA